MRAPSQVRLESADEYCIRHAFQLDAEHSYVVGDKVSGDFARTWPTFRSLIGCNWLVPVFDVNPVSVAWAPASEPVTRVRTRKAAR